MSWAEGLGTGTAWIWSACPSWPRFRAHPTTGLGDHQPTLPAEHEGPISSVCVSPDGLRVLSTTSSGHLGFLDILSREYSVLVRSHAAPVLALATESSRGQLATVSQDHTVRIWDLATLQQVGCGRREASQEGGTGGPQAILRPGGWGPEFFCLCLGPEGSRHLERDWLSGLVASWLPQPVRPHVALSSSCTTSRLRRRPRVLLPSTLPSPPSSVALAAGPSVPSAWRPPRS